MSALANSIGTMPAAVAEEEMVMVPAVGWICWAMKLWAQPYIILVCFKLLLFSNFLFNCPFFISTTTLHPQQKQQVQSSIARQLRLPTRQHSHGNE